MQTSSSSFWQQLGAGAIGAALGYAEGQSVDVAANSDPNTNPDIAALYYGYSSQQAAGQPAYGYAQAQGSGGISGGGLLLIAAVIVGVVLVLKA
jgi:hypothetical protein